jgi:hypothetical protein
VLRSLADGLLGGQEMNALVHGCKCFSRGHFWFLLWFSLLCKERGSPRLSLQQVQLSFLSCFVFCTPLRSKAVPFASFWPLRLCRCLVLFVKICFADGEELKCVIHWARLLVKLVLRRVELAPLFCSSPTLNDLLGASIAQFL